jgi:N-methylhydantoinase B
MAEVGFPPASTSVISGKDPRREGRDFVNMVVLGQSGGAASPKGDAWLTVGHVGNAGLLMRDSAEIAESAHPVVIWVNRLNPNSEGAGRFRGSPSAWVEYGPVTTEMEVVWATDGNDWPPQGACGGLPGSPSRQYRRDAEGELDKKPSYGRMTLKPWERLVSFSAGGGGYGSPRERDPELVAADVAAGFIDLARAEDVYGVVVDARGEVDVEATAACRATD